MLCALTRALNPPPPPSPPPSPLSPPLPQAPPLDKKREKGALDKARSELRARLAAESTPALVLHLAVLVLHLEHNGTLLLLNGLLMAS